MTMWTNRVLNVHCVDRPCFLSLYEEGVGIIWSDKIATMRA